MPPGVKEQLGLKDPKSPNKDPQTNAGSTEQADKFKADYQASASKINESLQYTAAYAQKSKHDPHAAKRDTLCQAYQVALGRIDPTNPSVAKGAIDQVLSTAKQLQTTTETLKTTTEKAYNAWTARQSDLETLTNQVREMVDWGHEKAAPLQQVLDAINSKSKERAYEEALTALEQLLSKAAPIYADYQKQKAAKEEYEPALQALQPRLDQAKTCTFKALVPMQQDLSSAADQMQQAADKKDYVTALAQLRTLEGNVGAFETKLAEIEAKKAEYEQARAALDPKLGEASTSQFKSLAELDQQIVDLTSKTDAAASEEDYEQAVTLVNELTTKVDEKLAKVVELEAKKAEYETARAGVDPKIAEAASSHPYKALDELNQQITDLTTKTDTAATDEKYDEAVTLAGELTTKVDEKITKAKELDEKKAAYEPLAQELSGRMPNQSDADYPSLGPLQTELVSIEDQMKAAADAEDYDKALEHANNLKTKLEEYETKKKELDEKKAAYETLAQELSGRMPNQSDADYPSLGPLQTELVSIDGQMKAAADAKDYDKATEHANNLKTKLEEYETKKKELDAKKAEYEAAVQALQPKLPKTCPVNPKLSALDGEITALKGQMEAAAASKDYEKALELVKQVSAKADEFQKALEEFEKSKQAYEAAVQALQPKLPTTCPVNASLAERHAQIMALKGQMEAAAASQDYVKALELAKQVTAKADEYQKAVKEKPPSPEKVKEVQDLITAGKKDEAIQKAMEYYGVDKSQAKSIVYDATVKGEAVASKDGSVKVGDKAFSSPGWLASSTAHELEVHVNQQAKQDKWYTGKMGTAIQEVQAYDHEIANAHKYDLTEAEIKDLKKRRKEHYDELNADYKKQADSGNYDMKKGEEGL